MHSACTPACTGVGCGEQRGWTAPRPCRLAHGRTQCGSLMWTRARRLQEVTPGAFVVLDHLARVRFDTAQLCCTVCVCVCSPAIECAIEAAPIAQRAGERL